MNKERQPPILENLEQYDRCTLECDGLTRVLSYLLTVDNVEHEVKFGKITDERTGNNFAPHFWIDLPDGRCIDYRARMWLGEHEHIPHGIFDPKDYEIKYSGTAHPFQDLETIAQLLLKLDCPD